MWDDILEIVARVLDTAIDVGWGSKNPILIAISALAWLAVIVLLLWVGIAEKSVALIVLGVVLLGVLAIWLLVRIIRYRRRER